MENVWWLSPGIGRALFYVDLCRERFKRLGCDFQNLSLLSDSCK
jgi:hypothetical protein